jgi:hypothetical protein
MDGRSKHTKGKNTAEKINSRHNLMSGTKGDLCQDIQNGRP